MSFQPPPVWRLAPKRAATLGWRDLAVGFGLAFLLLPALSGAYFAACVTVADPFVEESALPGWLDRDLQQFTFFHAAATAWAMPAALLAFLLARPAARRGLVGLVPAALAGAAFGASSGLLWAASLHGWPLPGAAEVALIGAGIGVFFSVQVWLFLLLRRPDLFLRAP